MLLQDLWVVVFLTSHKNLLLALGGITFIVVYGLFDPAHFHFPPCPFKTITGWLCPGCGSQRAIHQALHGQLGNSFQLNPLFLPAVAYGVSSFIAAKFFPECWPFLRKKFFGLHAAYISLLVIITFWIGRNIF